jgi:hypothetical protein
VLSTTTPGKIVDTALATQSAALNAHVDAASQRLVVESQISQLSNTRIIAETQLVNLKMKEINADMIRIQAHNDLLHVKMSVGSTTTLEDQLQNVYQTRARQGIGGFYGETANPM